MLIIAVITLAAALSGARVVIVRLDIAAASAKALLAEWQRDPRASAAKLVEELREQAFAEADRIVAAAREATVEQERQNALRPSQVDQQVMRAKGVDEAIELIGNYTGEPFSPERRAAWAAWYTEWSEEMARRAQVMASPVSE